MKFIYTTDLHGDEHKYNQVLDYAIKKDYRIIHLGADLLPKGRYLLKIQKEFVKKFLKKWYLKASVNDIMVLASFGNDDLYSRKKYFKEFGANLLEETPVIDADSQYEFKSYPWVPVHPYGLLNGCKLDKEKYYDRLPLFYNPPRDLDKTGELVLIKNIRDHLLDRGTIEYDLKYFSASSKSIVSFHCPPAGLGLDVCLNGSKVGSVSIREWIEEHTPQIVLCGHIHESPVMSGRWRAKTRNGTMVVQPGQYGKDAIIIEIDTDNMESMERKILK